MPPEAFSRVLIDKALEASGGDLSKQVKFELVTATGRADYVLNGQYDLLCVIEAKVEQVASRKRLDDLFQSMLHRAFNGEL